MKNISIISLAVAGFVLAGCGEDFLERYPYGQWHSENFEAEEIPYNILIEGELAQAYNAQHSYDFNAGAPCLHSIATDDADKGSTASDMSWAMVIDAHTWDASAGVVRQYYNAWYSVITYCNRAIEYCDAAGQFDESLTAEKVNNYKAQALTIRAHAYFRLVQAFGDVPFVEQELEQDDQTPPRTPYTQVYSNIIEDLNWSIPYLETRRALVESGNLGRVSQNSARAVLAKIYMYQKDWATSMSYCRQIIESGDNDLSTPFDEIWTEKYEFGPESIYEFDVDYKPSLSISTAGNNQWASIQGFRGQPNCGWGMNGPSELLRNDMKDDPRYHATVLSDGDVRDGVVFQSAEVPNPHYNAKVYAPLYEQQMYNRNNPNATWLNIRMIRYSDIVLMYAEAANELGQTDEALAKLEMVRARARGNDPDALPEITERDQTKLRELIHEERRFELALEFERYFDLVRWGETDKITGFVPNKQELYPIPQQEIDASNGILTQNPGY